MERDREMGKKERKIEREQKGRKPREFEERDIERLRDLTGEKVT